MAQFDKVRFVVVDDNTLGYIDPAQPEVLGILHASPLRGATRRTDDGWCYLPTDPAKIRPATREDFDTYMISTAGYESNPRYDFPGAPTFDLAVWSPMSSATVVIATSEAGMAWAESNLSGPHRPSPDLGCAGYAFDIAMNTEGDTIRAAIKAGLTVAQCNNSGRPYGINTLEGDGYGIAIAPFNRIRDRDSADAWTEA